MKENFEDKYCPSDNKDRPYGWVIFKRDDGKIMFKKHNMIVDGGRNFLKTCMLSTKGSILTAGSFKFGIGTIPTSANDSALGSAIDSSSDNKVILLDNESFLADSNENGEHYIKGTCHIKGINNNSYSISELGLFLQGTDAFNGKMFSRLVFEAVPVSEKVGYTVEYYIYF